MFSFVVIIFVVLNVFALLLICAACRMSNLSRYRPLSQPVSPDDRRMIIPSELQIVEVKKYQNRSGSTQSGAHRGATKISSSTLHRTRIYQNV